MIYKKTYSRKCAGIRFFCKQVGKRFKIANIDMRSVRYGVKSDIIFFYYA